MRVFERASVCAAALALLLVALLVAGADVARAQAALELPPGGSASLSNRQECAPDVVAEIFLDPPAGEAVSLGTAKTDSLGHFAAIVTVPDDVAAGDAAIVVDCGIAGSVLIYEIELVPSGGSSLSLSPWLMYLVAGLAIVALMVVGVVISIRRERTTAWIAEVRRRVASSAAESVTERMDDGLSESAADTDSALGDLVTPDEAESVSVPSAETTAEAGSADSLRFGVDAADELGSRGPQWLDPVDAEPLWEAVSADMRDDGADYWVWDTETSAGAARRIACLSATTFHLDEVPERSFPGLLERIADEGPDAAFAGSFLSVRLDDVLEVLRRGTKLRIVYRDLNGVRVVRTIDLGSEIDAVIELLGRRFVVQEVPVPA